MSTHTPGPWRVTVNGGFHDGQPSASVWIDAGDYRSLATLIPVREVEANARLIAAAPDLLFALQLIRETSGDPVMENIAAAAIAKAEGRTNGETTGVRTTSDLARGGQP